MDRWSWVRFVICVTNLSQLVEAHEALHAPSSLQLDGQFCDDFDQLGEAHQALRWHCISHLDEPALFASGWPS